MPRPPSGQEPTVDACPSHYCLRIGDSISPDWFDTSSLVGYMYGFCGFDNVTSSFHCTDCIGQDSARLYEDASHTPHFSHALRPCVPARPVRIEEGRAHPAAPTSRRQQVMGLFRLLPLRQTSLCFTRALLRFR